MTEEKKKNKSDRDLELREACKVQGAAEAEVIKSYLESAGIPVIFRGLVVQSVHAFTADGLGEVRILVPAEHLSAARKLLDQKSGEE